MARSLSPQRRKVVAMAAAIASVSGLIPTLTHGHPYVAWTIIGLMMVGLVYVIAQMVKLRRDEDCGC